jgi:hypothetical protein
MTIVKHTDPGISLSTERPLGGAPLLVKCFSCAVRIQDAGFLLAQNKNVDPGLLLTTQSDLEPKPPSSAFTLQAPENVVTIVQCTDRRQIVPRAEPRLLALISTEISNVLGG